MRVTASLVAREEISLGVTISIWNRSNKPVTFRAMLNLGAAFQTISAIFRLLGNVSAISQLNSLIRFHIPV